MGITFQERIHLWSDLNLCLSLSRTCSLIKYRNFPHSCSSRSSIRFFVTFQFDSTIALLLISIIVSESSLLSFINPQTGHAEEKRRITIGRRNPKLSRKRNREARWTSTRWWRILAVETLEWRGWCGTRRRRSSSLWSISLEGRRYGWGKENPNSTLFFNLAFWCEFLILLCSVPDWRECGEGDY